MSVNNDGKGVSAKEKHNRRHQAIISLIRENADISQVKMASRLEVSTKTIEFHIICLYLRNEIFGHRA